MAWSMRKFHSSKVGRPGKGRAKSSTCGPSGIKRKRSPHCDSDSSETIQARAGRVGRFKNGAPVPKLWSSPASKVVLPVFHWLVRRVMSPGSRKPLQSHGRAFCAGGVNPDES